MDTVLAMGNSAAMNIGCRYLLELFNFTRYLSRSELTGSFRGLFLFFSPPAICISCMISLP